MKWYCWSTIPREEVKLGVTSSQQAFTLKCNIHLPPATQDVNDAALSTFIKSPVCEIHLNSLTLK